MTAMAYAYDTTATATSVYDSAAIFANSKTSLCPLATCTLTQSDCTTALVAPFDTLLSIEANTPWTIKVSQTLVSGYPDVTVCYSCTNKDSITNSNEQTLTNQVTLR